MVETRRQQIENTASELFRERGYAATSVRDIARALDMQGASLYAHVASKEDVLWSIVMRAADRFEAAISIISENAPGSAVDELASMIRAHVQVVTDDLGNAASFVHEWRFLSGARRAIVADRRDAYEARFRRVIERGVAATEMAPNTSPSMAATLILSALNGIAAWYRSDGALVPAEVAECYARMLLDGLRRPIPTVYAAAADAEHATGRILR